MLFGSVLTSAFLALQLGSDALVAAKHGRFAELSRAPLAKAKRAVEATQHKPERSDKKHRFLSDDTKRECDP